MFMDPLTLFGLFAVTGMVVFYALERRSAWFILAFAGACALASVYGFLQGAWPFGVVEAVWTVVAVQHWRRLRVRAGKTKKVAEAEEPDQETDSEKTAREIILEAIRAKGKARRSDLLPLLKMSKSTLVRLLDKMEAEGLVVQVGERKATYYAIKEG
jgi:uncharacterized membrane protein